MPINVSEALDLETGEIVTYVREIPGQYVDGIWVPGSTTTFKSITSVQQPTPKQVEVLPEGERSKNLRVFISKKPLRATDDKKGTVGDIAIYQGARYRMMFEGNWKAFGHSTMIGAEENDS